MKLFSAVIALHLGMAGAAFPQGKTMDAEKEAIKNLIERTYIDVLYHGGDIAKLEEGFHAEFNMYYYYEKQVQKRSLQAWVDRLREVRSRDAAAKNGEDKKPECSHEFRLIDVTGYTAVAKFDIFFDGKLKYTDYLTLYKTDDKGWQVITKQFTAYN